jgi:hypothetical protein
VRSFRLNGLETVCGIWSRSDGFGRECAVELDPRGFRVIFHYSGLDAGSRAIADEIINSVESKPIP